MANILLTEKVSPDAVAILRRKHKVEEFLEWSPDDLQKKIKGFDALVVRSKTKVDKKLMDAGTSLKAIARAGAGLDNVDRAYAESKGIRVINTPNANSLSVAELTLGLALSVMRNIPRADMTMREGLWEKKVLRGAEISGKTWGILGFGHIGQLVAGLLKGFGCRVLAYDPYLAREKFAPAGAEQATLEEILKQADVVSIHVPLLDSTRNLIGAKELAVMKPSAILINISRGGIVDEAALCEALKSKRIRGAALDVFVTEPPEGSPLLGLDNIVLTCHLGAETADAQRRVGEQIVEKLLEALG